MEKLHIQRVLNHTRGNKTEAARLLKDRLVRTLDELSKVGANDLLQARYAKFRKMGNFFLGA